MPIRNSIPPNGNGDVPLDALLKATADSIEVVDKSIVNPSKGRVIEDPETGTIYLGDGSQWIQVDQDSGIDTPAVTTDELRLMGDIHTAATDAELDDVVSAASAGDLVILGKGTFSKNRTFSTALQIQGRAVSNDFGSVIAGDWTFNSPARVTDVNITSGAVTFNAVRSQLDGFTANLSGVTLTANDNEIAFVNGRGGEVTFASGTSLGLVDSCVSTGVTDNGNNTVGDIS